jgi:hypothetical protein
VGCGWTVWVVVEVTVTLLEKVTVSVRTVVAVREILLTSVAAVVAVIETKTVSVAVIVEGTDTVTGRAISETVIVLLAGASAVIVVGVIPVYLQAETYWFQDG